MIVTGEFAVEERGVPGRYGRTSGDESESTISIRNCEEELSPAALGKKDDDSCLVEEVVPGNDIENIGSFRNVRSGQQFVNTVASDQRLGRT